MLQQLIIENFVRISHLVLDPRAPVVLIAGHNEQGKSSLAEAIRFLLIGDSPRVALKRDRADLVHNGAKIAYVSATIDNATVKRTVRDGKVSGDGSILPTDHEAGMLCLQADSLATLGDESRRAILLRLAKVDLSDAAIAEKLVDKGVSMDAVLKYKPLLKGGLKLAHETAKREAADARGQWREVTGEAYGSQKAETWEPTAPVVSVEEAGQQIAEIDGKIVEARAARDAELAPILAEIQAYKQQLAKPDPLSCPHCGGAVLYQGGALKVFEGAASKDGLQARLNVAQMKSSEVAKRHDDHIRDLEADRAALRSQITAAETAAHKKKRAQELHENVKAFSQLAELLGEGPDGIAAELIAGSLKPLNDRLIEIAQPMGWTPVQILGDMSIQRTDGYTYNLLSESAKWRVDAMLQILISELAGYRFLVFDRFDVLELKARAAFMMFLNSYVATREDEPSVIVLGTMKERPSTGPLTNIEAHWIEKGRLVS